MGFSHLAAGWRVFCPETRRYFLTNNAYFFEDMRHRIDSLHHHDLRRQMIKRGEEQPFALDDFHHDELAIGDSARQLYLSPGAPLHSGKRDRSSDQLAGSTASEVQFFLSPFSLSSTQTPSLPRFSAFALLLVWLS